MPFWSVFALFLMIIGLCPTRAGLIWQQGEGWIDEAGDAMHTSSAKSQLEAAHSLEAKEDWKDALKAYEVLLHSWPLSIYSGEAQFKIGLMQEKRGDFWAAYKAYEKVVSKFPGSPFFDLAVEREYSIGMLYLAGEPQRIWKIPLLPSMDKTVEIFESVIKAAPYGKWAPSAYFQVGQAREKQGKWTKAIEAYNMILDKYPNSDMASAAQYQIGFAWLSAASKPDYDQSAAQKSIEAFEDYISRFPKSEKVEQAKKHIAELKSRITQGSFDIAKFYESQKNYKAAYVYYNEVIRENPDSDQAKFAKERVEALKPIVEKNEPPSTLSTPQQQTNNS